jgi:flagellar protein FlaH
MVVRRFAGMASPVDDTIGFSVEQGRGITIESRTIA